jgi:hypothetical protein
MKFPSIFYQQEIEGGVPMLKGNMRVCDRLGFHPSCSMSTLFDRESIGPRLLRLPLRRREGVGTSDLPLVLQYNH